MLFNNCTLFTPDRGFVKGGFSVADSRFACVFEGAVPDDIDADQTVDLHEAVVIPGLVDIHIHGACGCDISDGDSDGLMLMASYLAKCGVTSFVPTTMTISSDDLKKALDAAEYLRDSSFDGQASRIAGVRMEGPFLSAEKCGSQNRAYLRYPDFDAFRLLCDSHPALIKLIDTAPELAGAISFIRGASAFCKVSVGHTCADYVIASKAFDEGASHVTHLFDAMPALLHRSPGVIGAASERDTVTAEIICDGIHVHPSAVRAAFRLFPGRLCLISDAVRCLGMPAGDYELSGQKVSLRDGAAWLNEDTLAGSATDLFEGMKKAVSFGISTDEAVAAASSVPAAVIGAQDEIGSIAPGRYADFVICDADLNKKDVFIGGEKIL